MIFGTSIFQFAAFYDADGRLLGGGIIDATK